MATTIHTHSKKAKKYIKQRKSLDPGLLDHIDNADGKKKITKNHETLYKQRTCNSLLPSIDSSLDWSPLTKMNESMKGGKEKRRKILKTEEPFGVATWCGGEAC